jgi:hypothetical protein
MTSDRLPAYLWPLVPVVFVIWMAICLYDFLRAGRGPRVTR